MLTYTLWSTDSILWPREFENALCLVFTVVVPHVAVVTE